MENSRNATTIRFWAFSLLISSILLAATLPASVAEAKPASVLLQEGLYAEEIEGDLDGAIKIYEQVIAESQPAQQTAAQAMYRLGMCYLKKGEKEKAAERFREVLSKFPEQGALAAKAQEQLERIAPPVHQRQLPPEVMTYIVGLHFESYAEAQPYNIKANTRVYGVDNEFNLYNGGIFVIKNDTAETWTGEIPLSNFSYSDLDLFNEQGRKQRIRMVDRGTTRGGRYKLFWTLDKPVRPGEMRTMGWRTKGTEKLPQRPTDKAYHLSMNNRFGAEVLENFFLVVPYNVAIKEQSKEYISRVRMGIFEIYQWQSRVPYNTTNAVDVVLTEGPGEFFGVFGPERFEKLYDIDHKTTKDKVRAIDFDQGRLLKIPTYLDNLDNEQESMKWLAENGIDAVAEITEKTGGLIGFGMTVVAVEPLWWPGMGPAPEQVSSVIRSAPSAPMETTPMLLSDAFPYQLIFAFRTREGGVGILQVLDADKKPQHVEFHYRMLQQGLAESQERARRVKSGRILSNLGQALTVYANEQETGQFPDTLRELWEGDYFSTENLEWALRNVAYLGKGKTAADPPDTVVAYDRVTLQEGNGTNVLYLDMHVEFLPPDGLEKLGIRPTTGAYVFGPVVERVVNDDGEETNWLVDFDTGKLFSHSIDIDSEEKFFKWVAENGIDAMGESRASSPGLYGFDMAAIPLANARWEGISANRWREELSITKPGTPAVMSAKGDLPATFMVKTREGGMGVVQITEMITNVRPRHFKIRYKMLQEQATTVAGPAEPLPVDELVRSGWVPRFRAVIYDNTALDLETGTVKALKRRPDWTEEYEVVWDNDMGGALMVRPGSATRIVGLPSVEKGSWDEAILKARNMLTAVRGSIAKGIAARKSRFSAVLTNEGHLAVIEIGEYSPEKAEVSWWLEKTAVAEMAEIVLPDADTPSAGVILDLASGELLHWPTQERGKALFTLLSMGQGDLAYDRAVICVRGAKACLWMGYSWARLKILDQMQDATVYELEVRHVPGTLFVTTAEGRDYEVTLLSADSTGLKLKYRKAEGYAKERYKSCRMLQTLGMAALAYAEDHGGEFPERMESLESYLADKKDMAWFLGNVVFVGKGKTKGQGREIIAYDKTLLKHGNGTNGLYADGFVQFYDPQATKSILGTEQGQTNLEHQDLTVSESAKRAAENLAANGWLLLRQGELAEAEKVFRRAVRRDPTNTEALNGLATTCMRSEKYDEAVQYYKVWLKIEPNNADAKAGLEKAKTAAAR